MVLKCQNYYSRTFKDFPKGLQRICKQCLRTRQRPQQTPSITPKTLYNALTRGCHGRMTSPRGDCPPKAKPGVDNHLEVWSFCHVTRGSGALFVLLSRHNYFYQFMNHRPNLF